MVVSWKEGNAARELNVALPSFSDPKWPPAGSPNSCPLLYLSQDQLPEPFIKILWLNEHVLYAEKGMERNWSGSRWVGLPWEKKMIFSPPCPIFFESCWQNWYYPNVCGRCKGSFLGPSALEEGGRTDKHSSSKLTDVTCPWYMLAVASFPTSISFWVLSVPDWYSFKVNPVFPYKPLLVAFILAVCKVP